MKKSIFLVSLPFVLLPFTVSGQTFATGFESETVGDTTAANPSEIDGFRGNFPAAIVRDSTSEAPFGSSNQYIQFGGDGVAFFDGTNYSARAIVTGAPSSTFTDTVAGISFKMVDGTAGPDWGTHIGIGTGDNPWVPDLNGSNGLFALTFDDGAIGVGNNTSVASGALPSYSPGQAYEVTYMMNWTGVSESVTGVDGNSLSLDDKQIAFWIRDLTDNSLSSTVVLDSSFGAVDSSISPVFRNFNTSLSNMNVLYIDDIAVTSVPEPSTYAVILGFLALGLVFIRRRARSA